MNYERMGMLRIIIRTLPKEEKIKRLETAQKNGYITEEEREEILRTIESDIELKTEIRYTEPQTENILRPGKKSNDKKIKIEYNIDDFLDKVDTQVDEWEVHGKEQYTIGELREEINKLLMLNARVVEASEPKYRKEGDRYTSTDRLRIIADIGNRINEILRVLEGYRSEIEAENATIQIDRHVYEKKKSILEFFKRKKEPNQFEKGESVKTSYMPFVTRVTIDEKVAEENARRKAIVKIDNKSKGRGEK